MVKYNRRSIKELDNYEGEDYFDKDYYYYYYYYYFYLYYFHYYHSILTKDQMYTKNETIGPVHVSKWLVSTSSQPQDMIIFATVR